MINSIHKTNTAKLAVAIAAFVGAGLFSAYAVSQDREKTAKADTQAQQEIVRKYESVSEALVQDELSSAREAAQQLADTARELEQSNIADAAGKVAEADSLDAARDAFKALSSQVIALAGGNEDYTVMTCPMVEDGRWLQSEETVSNPYMGQKMPRCGMPASKQGMMGNMMKGMGKDCPMTGGMACCRDSASE